MNVYYQLRQPFTLILLLCIASDLEMVTSSLLTNLEWNHFWKVKFKQKKKKCCVW